MYLLKLTLAYHDTQSIPLTGSLSMEYERLGTLVPCGFWGDGTLISSFEAVDDNWYLEGECRVPMLQVE